MKAKSILKASVPVMVGVAGVALAVRYFGDQPVIKDIKEGLRGNAVGLFN